MENEGSITINSRRYGLLAFLRNKQWWSFEGLDPQRRIYFVFLALQGFPVHYVSMKVIDYQNNRRWTEDHLGSFQAAPGDQVDIGAEGKWGHLRFCGKAETGWQVDVQTSQLGAKFSQTPQAPIHHNWLLTQHIDYNINQFVMNHTQGILTIEGEEHRFEGYGYHEHNWGIQPRHSTAHWLHFWCPEVAGVILSCHYDSGVPHHYTYLWHKEQSSYLYSPAHFSFNPSQPDSPWQVSSPDLDLHIQPLAGHHTRMKVPPILTYTDIDYYEQLLEVQGSAWIHGEPVQIAGTGKMDHNWNRW